jgi:signal recognition particle subunit SRP19
MKEDGVLKHSTIKNKFMLYKAVAEYLHRHPMSKEEPLRLRLPNMPFDWKTPELPAVPRRWKMGSILPLHSAAVSGGG